MQSRTLTWILVLMGVLLGACGPQSDDEVVSASQQVTTSSTTTTESAGVTSTVTATTSAAVEDEPLVGDQDETVQAPDGAGLGVEGPYGVGLHRFEVMDSTRNRTFQLSVWYPATTSGTIVETDAPADRSRSPYPVIVGSMRGATMWAPHFASHGYVFAGTPGVPEDGWDTWILDYALDRLFALDQLEAIADEPLTGLADTRHTGVIDYSFGSIPTMVLAGARIDPDSYLTSCTSATDLAPAIQDNNCQAADNWDTFERHAVDLGVATEEGLWRSVTDERITAVIPGAPEGGALFGERGLAAATVPVLFMTGSADDLNGYEFETAYMYNHIGSPADLVTFVGADHFMILSSDGLQQFERFATAFFGLHLKEDNHYGQFLNAEFVEVAPSLGIPPKVYESLTWGLYTE